MHELELPINNMWWWGGVDKYILYIVCKFFHKILKMQNIAHCLRAKPKSISAWEWETESEDRIPLQEEGGVLFLRW